MVQLSYYVAIVTSFSRGPYTLTIRQDDETSLSPPSGLRRAINYTIRITGKRPLQWYSFHHMLLNKITP